MAECSQKFKDMLDLFGETSWENGAGETRLPPVRWLTYDALLQYVAELEEYKHTFMVRGYGSRPQDMTGGMP